MIGLFLPFSTFWEMFSLNFINMRTISWYVYRASEKGHYEIVELLVKKGATGLANHYTGITPLYAACVQGHVDIARILLKRFPESSKRGTKVESNNPLHIVSGCGNVELTKMLLQSDDG